MRARDKGGGGGSEMGSETEEHKSRTSSDVRLALDLGLRGQRGEQ